MEFRLLGPLEVASDGRDLTPARPKRRALLAALLLRVNELIPTDELIEILWGESPPRSAQTALQGHVSALRKDLGPEAIETRPPGYVLRAEPAAIDTRRFELLLEKAGAEHEPLVRSELLREALELFRGEPLVDFRYESFARDEAARLERLRLRALEEWVEADLELGRHAELVPELERLAREHPYEERLRTRLMLALYRSGGQADALQVYAETRRRLVEELGVEPGPELQLLERRILNQDPALAAPPSPRLRRLGRHELPTSPMPLIGRDLELAEVDLVLQEARLVTLTGPAGTGKTRLALAAARALADSFDDGTLFIELAPIADPALVLPTVRQALDIREHGGRSTEELLASALHDKRALLVLDNCEHVLDGMIALPRLLNAAPEVTVLATSRESLRVSGERIYPVPPLASDAAVLLFVERAQAVRPDFLLTETNKPAVEEICRRLDHLPLAIELAAARVGVFPPAALLARLDERLELLTGGRRDEPSRHRTLRAAIDWSHELLSRPQRTLFRQLSVFTGGCTLDAAEAVCDDDLEVIDDLASLIDKNLVKLEGRDEEPRFTMLETIREYALERLEASGEAAAIRRRHAEYFLELVQNAPGADASPALSANVADTSMWRARVQRDYVNIFAARRWFQDTGDVAGEFRLVFVLTWLFLWIQGGMREAGRMYEAVLSRDDKLLPVMRVDALQSLAHFGTYLDWETRRRLAEESLALARALGDKGRIEWSLRRLACVLAVRQEDPASSRRMLLECELLAKELPEEGRLAWIHQNLGVIALQQGEYEEAQRRLEESLEMFERIGGAWQAANCMCCLAALAILEHRYADATQLLALTLTRTLDLGMLNHAAQCLDNSAAVALSSGSAELAARLLGAAAAVRDDTGDETAEEDWEYERQMRARTSTAVRERLGARFEREWDAGKALTLEEAAALAFDSLSEPGSRVSQARAY